MSRWERFVEWCRWNLTCCGWKSRRHDWTTCDCNCHEAPIRDCA